MSRVERTTVEKRDTLTHAISGGYWQAARTQELVGEGHSSQELETLHELVKGCDR